MVLVVQVRSSVMCTPRNLVLLTLSTVELPMVSGGWSMEFLLLKSNTTSFVFSTLSDSNSGEQCFDTTAALLHHSLLIYTHKPPPRVLPESVVSLSAR